MDELMIRNASKYAVGKLYREGKISAKFSPHDLRHFYAIQEYRKEKDIHRLRTLLNRASIQVTETHLKGLEQEWD
jgi:site-specific recombinase XerD